MGRKAKATPIAIDVYAEVQLSNHILKSDDLGNYGYDDCIFLIFNHLFQIHIGPL